jgi:hypothetical protein
MTNDSETIAMRVTVIGGTVYEPSLVSSIALHARSLVSCGAMRRAVLSRHRVPIGKSITLE